MDDKLSLSIDDIVEFTKAFYNKQRMNLGEVTTEGIMWIVTILIISALVLLLIFGGLKKNNNEKNKTVSTIPTSSAQLVDNIPNITS